MNQTAFAALGGASRRAMVNWESDGAAPLATALIAWADAGADPLYILTGKRTFGHPDDLGHHVREQLAIVRRDILAPATQRLPGESAEDAERRLLAWHADKLSSILRDDGQLLPHDLKEEVAHMLDVTTNDAARALYRAGEYAQLRAKRRRLRDQIASYAEMHDQRIPETALNIMAAIGAEHDVPIDQLIELALELSGADGAT